MEKIMMLMSACLALASVSCLAASEEKTPKGHPVVLFETTAGNIKIELYEDKAPKTVDNFLNYVEGGHYNGTIFHRVINGFMIQGGGFTKEMAQKPTQSPIINEADNGLKNERGTIAMARTSDINSATSQFFINVVDNAALDFKNKTPMGYGYCVFGKVIEGMDTVDKIKNTATGSKHGHQNVPLEAIEIVKASRIN